MPLLFSSTLFLSAFLLFLIQPMIAKMILPRFGGTPAVWNTCIVFFQAVLLAGYSYTHLSTARLGSRRHASLHRWLLFLGLVLVPLVFVPIGLAKNWAPPGGANPFPWVLGLLLVSIGFPFFVISTTAPLLQRWFAEVGPHPPAPSPAAAGEGETASLPGKDPYYLYVVSNLGSLLALAGYPLLIEPNLSPEGQVWLWVAGYAVLIVLILSCARFLKGEVRLLALDSRLSTHKERSAGVRLRWLALAFCPASLMLGVTTYLSTDISPMPLIWVIPLALYLLSFVLTFARPPAVIHKTLLVVLPILVGLQTYLMLSRSLQQVGVQMVLHLLLLFVVAMVCHGELANSRPAASRLTEFYVWMCTGGILGSLFNALAAPLIFKTVVEYPLVLVAACLLLPDPRRVPSPTAAAEAPRKDKVLFGLAQARWLDLLLPGLLGALTAVVFFWLDVGEEDPTLRWMRDQLSSQLQAGEVFAGMKDVHSNFDWFFLVLKFGLPCLVCFLFIGRPVRFGLAVGAVLLAGAWYAIVSQPNVLLRERSFFGVIRVETGGGRRLTTGDNFMYLYHGGIRHGAQSIDPFNRPIPDSLPLTYYYPTGPIGQIFAARKATGRKDPVAVVGLGTGSLAYYACPGQEFTFFEIDPVIERIARDDRYFTYLRDAKKIHGANPDVVLGDARISLTRMPENHYGLIVVDAFSSDAIPTHLITREALRVYLDKLSDDGILAFHISNRYLDLTPVLANLAEDAGVPVRLLQVDPPQAAAGKFASRWVLLSRLRPLSDARILAGFVPQTSPLGNLTMAAAARIACGPLDLLTRDPRWRKIPLTGRPEVGVWSDGFANLYRVIRWDALKNQK